MKNLLFLGLSCLSLGSSVVAEPQKSIEPTEVVVVATKGKKTFRQKFSKFVWLASAVCVGVCAATLACVSYDKANAWLELKKLNKQQYEEQLKRLKEWCPQLFENEKLHVDFELKEETDENGCLTNLMVVNKSTGVVLTDFKRAQLGVE